MSIIVVGGEWLGKSVIVGVSSNPDVRVKVQIGVKRWGGPWTDQYFRQSARIICASRFIHQQLARLRIIC